MSKGSPVCTVRLPRELLALVGLQISSRNSCAADDPYGVSGFIFEAVAEKLLKMARSRRRRTDRGLAADLVRAKGAGLPSPAEVKALLDLVRAAKD